MNTKKLYYLMMNNECHLGEEKGKVYSWIAVYFNDIDNFTSIVGADCFDEGGINVRLFNDYIAIELNDILDYVGEDIEDYEDCFSVDEWNRYIGGKS